MKEEKKAPSRTPGPGETLLGSEVGQKQVDFAVTQRLLSTGAGLQALRLWRSTDWTTTAALLRRIEAVLGVEPVTDRRRRERELRWCQIEQEILRDFAQEVAGEAMHLLFEYVEAGAK